MVNSGVCFTLAPLRPFLALLRHFPQKREPLSQTLSNYAFKSGTSFQYQRLITMGVIKACSIKNTNFAWLEGQHRYSAMFLGVYTFKTCFYSLHSINCKQHICLSMHDTFMVILSLKYWLSLIFQKSCPTWRLELLCLVLYFKQTKILLSKYAMPFSRWFLGE